MINNYHISGVDGGGNWLRCNTMIKEMDIEIYKEECYCGLNVKSNRMKERSSGNRNSYNHEEDIYSFSYLFYSCHNHLSIY